MAVVPFEQALLDAIDDPVLVVAGSTVTHANRAAKQLLGEAFTGRDVRLAIRHPLALQLILDGKESEQEVSGIASAERPWRLIVRPIGGGRMLVRLIDRSATMAAERTRTDFVANASHELRTPLAAIIGYAETLSDEDPIDDELRAKFGSVIQTDARRMLRIVEDLMSLSRIEADRYRTPADLVDLAEIVRSSISHLTPMHQGDWPQFELDIAADLPLVRGDRAQLAQAVDNLAANAVRYGRGENGTPISVGLHLVGSRLVLSVRDHGEGIAPEHIPRLTERFYRVDAARSRDKGGTGLGLAIVKHIVERHRGTLTIQSTPGEGTNVEMSIPAA